jgi:hypothetical protein
MLKALVIIPVLFISSGWTLNTTIANNFVYKIFSKNKVNLKLNKNYALFENFSFKC